MRPKRSAGAHAFRPVLFPRPNTFPSPLRTAGYTAMQKNTTANVPAKFPQWTPSHPWSGPPGCASIHQSGTIPASAAGGAARPGADGSKRIHRFSAKRPVQNARRRARPPSPSTIMRRGSTRRWPST